jgi:AraC-like DNA-binding protein
MIVILLSIIGLTLVYCLYLIYNINRGEAFLDILKIYLFYELFHVSYTIVMKSMFAELKYLDMGAPFAFAYGPLFYFAVHTSLNETTKLNLRRFFRHLAPSFFFWLVFITVILFKSNLHEHLWTYYTALAIAQGASMLSYTLWAILSSQTRQLLVQMDAKNTMLNIASALLGIMAVFFVVIAISRVIPRKTAPPGLGSYLIYGSIFTVVISICRYLHRRNIRERNTTDKLIETQDQLKISRYEKSGVASDLLSSYYLRLEKLMVEDKIFLNSSLTLENISSLLRISKHHASQLFNNYLTENFNTYVNKHRIEWACKLLISEVNMTVDEVGVASGVTSKATFNRTFKQLKGCSPKEYRIKHKNI